MEEQEPLWTLVLAGYTLVILGTLTRVPAKALGFPKLNRPRLGSALRSVPASRDARRFTLAVSGSRPQRTLIAYVDGPNEGPAEMVIIGGYR